MPKDRLDKILALNCNVSRKEARQMIKDGTVRINGQIILKAEYTVDTDNDTVDVDGYDFKVKEHIYIMLNKPQGVISATSDPGKPTVIDLIPDELMRRSLFPCGRLDRDTTGLLLITDDGAYSHRIMSPSHHVFKTYEAVLSKPLSANDIEILEGGITLGDGTVCLPAKVKYTEENGVYTAVIKIREGKYHQVKRMFGALGNNVDSLRRIQIGALKLDPLLNEGESRELTEKEKELVFSDDTLSETE